MFQRERIQQERERIHQAHGECGLTVLDILARHDPLRIVCEPNPSEYEPILDILLQRLQAAQCPEQVQRIAHEAVAQWLGTVNAGSETAYVVLGQELWEAMQKQRLL